MWFIGIWTSFQGKLLFLTLLVFWEVFQAHGKDAPESFSLGGPLQILMIPCFPWKATNRYTQSHMLSAAAGTNIPSGDLISSGLDRLPGRSSAARFCILGRTEEYFVSTGIKTEVWNEKLSSLFLKPWGLSCTSVLMTLGPKRRPRNKLRMSREQHSCQCSAGKPSLNNCWNTGSETRHEWCRGLPLLALCQKKTPFCWLAGSNFVIAL